MIRWGLSRRRFSSRRSGASLFPFSLTPTTFSDNATTINQGAYQQTSPLARAVFVTTATSVIVNGYCTIFANFPAFSEIGVYVNGVFLQSLIPTANGAFSATLTLGAGSKTVTIVNGTQTKISNVIMGTYLVSIGCNAAVTQSFPAVTARALFLTDSIGAGSNAIKPTQYSYISRLRNVTTDSMTVYGWGYNTLMSIAGDSTLRAALMSVITPLAPTRIVDTLGTNDYALVSATPANFAIAKAALYDAIHTALPTATIFTVKPIVRSDEGVANGLGFTIADYRTAFDTAATGRTWVTVVNGFAFMTGTALDDGVHPNNYGHLLWAQGIGPSLGYTVPGNSVTNNPMNAGPDALGTLTTVSAGVYTIEKTTASAAFDCGFYGATRTGDFRYQIDAIVNCDFMVGVNASAGTQSGYADMSDQIYPDAGGGLAKYNGATSQGTATPGTRGSGTAGRLWVDRTGTTFTISMGVTYAGAAVLRTDTLSGTYAIDFSIYQLGGKMTVTVVI